MSTDTDTRIRELTLKRDELMKRIDSIKQDMRSGLDKDWEEQAVQLENAEVLDEIARVSMEELAKVNVAIERLKKLSP